MKAAVWNGPHDLTIEELSRPSPGEGELLLKTRVVGICETDVEIYSGRFPQAKPPMVLGHEGGGIVEASGPGVTGFEPGDPVIAECILYCGQCYYCKLGMRWLCKRGAVKGVEGENNQGEYAEYFVIPAKNCHRLPASISWKEAGLIDTLACPVHALQKINMGVGSTVAVFGPGPAGLFFSRLAKLRGAKRVFLVGTRDNRLELGRTFGADEVININHHDPVPYILENTGGQGTDLVIEASGSERAFNDCTRTLRKGGAFLLYGVFGGGPIQAHIQNIQRCEYTVHGAAGQDYATAIDLLDRGEIKLADLITHTFTLEELPEALGSGLISERRQGYLKGVVLF